MTLKILTNPNQLLRQKSATIEKEEILSSDFQNFLKDLTQTMLEFDGAGIAAPQVGVSKKAIVVNTENGPRIFLNPKIVFKSFYRNILEEGCLSVPGVFGQVKRSKKIWIKYQDENNAWHRERCDTYLSRVLQHEYDHLNGVLFIDKVINKKNNF